MVSAVEQKGLGVSRARGFAPPRNRRDALLFGNGFAFRESTREHAAGVFFGTETGFPHSRFPGTTARPGGCSPLAARENRGSGFSGERAPFKQETPPGCEQENSDSLRRPRSERFQGNRVSAAPGPYSRRMRGK